MSEVLAIGFGLLMVIAIGPLVLLLCLWLIGDRLGAAIEQRLLDATVGLLTLQWLTGSWVNMIGGVALTTLGFWTAFQDVQIAHRAIALLIIVPGGLWRAWRGLVLFKSRKAD